MDEPVTKRDFQSTKADLQQVLAEQEARQDANLNHAVEVLEQKIDRVDQKVDQVKTDLIVHIDRANDRILQTVATALAEVPTRREFTTLEKRVTRLETTKRS